MIYSQLFYTYGGSVELIKQLCFHNILLSLISLLPESDGDNL